jgi:hypothetical protein
MAVAFRTKQVRAELDNVRDGPRFQDLERRVRLQD